MKGFSKGRYDETLAGEDDNLLCLSLEGLYDGSEQEAWHVMQHVSSVNAFIENNLTHIHRYCRANQE